MADPVWRKKWSLISGNYVRPIVKISCLKESSHILDSNNFFSWLIVCSYIVAVNPDAGSSTEKNTLV